MHPLATNNPEFDKVEFIENYAHSADCLCPACIIEAQKRFNVHKRINFRATFKQSGVYNSYSYLFEDIRTGLKDEVFFYEKSVFDLVRNVRIGALTFKNQRTHKLRMSYK